MEYSLNQFSSFSQSKLKEDYYRILHNNSKLENRLKILNLQKHRKIKSIEYQLKKHNAHVLTRIQKCKQNKALHLSPNKWKGQSSSKDSGLMILPQQKLAQNIRSRQAKDTNFLQKQQIHQQIKKQKQQWALLRKQQNQKRAKENIRLRSKVRLMEIQCKENISTFWQKKIDYYHLSRADSSKRRVEEHEKNILHMQHLEQQEQTILEELEKAEGIEQQIQLMVGQQAEMNCQNLLNLQ